MESDGFSFCYFSVIGASEMSLSVHVPECPTHQKEESNGMKFQNGSRVSLT